MGSNSLILLRSARENLARNFCASVEKIGGAFTFSVLKIKIIFYFQVSADSNGRRWIIYYAEKRKSPWISIVFREIQLLCSPRKLLYTQFNSILPSEYGNYLLQLHNTKLPRNLSSQFTNSKCYKDINNWFFHNSTPIHDTEHEEN